jgi:hypothetical protein
VDRRWVGGPGALITWLSAEHREAFILIARNVGLPVGRGSVDQRRLLVLARDLVDEALEQPDQHRRDGVDGARAASGSMKSRAKMVVVRATV